MALVAHRSPRGGPVSCPVCDPYQRTGALDALQIIAADRDRWKERALAAEARIDATEKRIGHVAVGGDPNVPGAWRGGNR